MMGQHDGQAELFSYEVNLERRVRADHPLRAIRSAIDLTFVRQEVAHCYGRNGNEPVDPVVIMKLMFVLFFDKVKSERELMRMLPERLDYLWFLGFGLEDGIPDHRFSPRRVHAGDRRCSSRCSCAPCSSVCKPVWSMAQSCISTAA